MIISSILDPPNPPVQKSLFISIPQFKHLTLEMPS